MRKIFSQGIEQDQGENIFFKTHFTFFVPRTMKRSSCCKETVVFNFRNGRLQWFFSEISVDEGRARWAILRLANCLEVTTSGANIGWEARSNAAFDHENTAHAENQVSRHASEAPLEVAIQCVCRGDFFGEGRKES